jgi:hypothetical protein
LTGASSEAGAEIILCDDIEPNVSGCGDARLRSHILQLLEYGTPARSKAAQKRIQNRSAVGEPPYWQHRAQAPNNVSLIANHVKSPRPFLS